MGWVSVLWNSSVYHNLGMCVCVCVRVRVRVGSFVSTL